jgi:Ankyrin repeats (3 copies)
LSRGTFGEKEEMVKQLLSDPRVDPESQDARGLTSLFHAVTNYSWTNKYAGILLASGRVDPNREDILGRTPLSHAAGTASVGAIELLLKYGAVADKKDHKGRSPLWWAKNWTTLQRRWTRESDYDGDYDFGDTSRCWEAERRLENRKDVDSKPKDNDGLAPDDSSLFQNN